MKAGIITIHNSPNYGACLQSFALWKYITGQGVDCEIIDLYRPYQKEYIPGRKFVPMRKQKHILPDTIKHAIKRLIGRNKEPKYFSDSAKEKFKKFNAPIKLSGTYRGIDELYANPPLYDLYISGSDQVWNPSQPYCMEPYFLTFAPKDKVKISYAASIGLSGLRENEKTKFKEWLSAYTAISVREKQGKALLESFSGLEVEQVPDPALLLDAEDWKKWAEYPATNEPYILLFTLSYSPEMVEYGKRLAQEAGMKLIVLGMIQPDCKDGSYLPVTDAGPREFLGYIAKARMVITDSFHGTVFSIITGANNFYTYIAPANKRGSRILDLLDTFGLRDHLLPVNLKTGYTELNTRKIDHSLLIQIMKKEQMKGQEFLNRYIKP